MRIVAGKYRGKKLWAPIGKDVRPTSERAREALFSILYSKIGGNYSAMNIADIYAGTGAFGFEALSRGFKSVTFVDIDTTAVRKNAKLFPAETDKIKIITANAAKLPPPQQKFDLIFMDAPYALGLTEKTLAQILQQKWLAEGGICIVETRKDETTEIPESFDLIDERIYGLAKVIFLKLK